MLKYTGKISTEILISADPDIRPIISCIPKISEMAVGPENHGSGIMLDNLCCGGKQIDFWIAGHCFY